MRVVFLDIDGVISKFGPKGNGMYGLSKPLLRNLSFLVKTSKAKIVLSSSWREFPEARRRLDRALRYKGLKINYSTPVFPNSDPKTRQAEIEQWLSEHPEVKDYVILDDIPDYFHGDLRDHLVTCDPNEGLTEEKTEEAINVLGVMVGSDE